MTKLILITVSLLGLLLGAVGLFSLQDYFRSHFLPNIWLEDRNVGYRHPDQVLEELAQDASLATLTSLTLTHAQAQFTLDLASIHLTPDWKSTVATAFEPGHSNQIAKNLQAFYQALTKSYHFPIQYSYRSADLDSYLASVSAQLLQPPIPPTITLEPGLIIKIASVSAGTTGVMVDTAQTKQHILTQIQTRQDTPIPLVLKPATHLVSTSQLELMRNLAQHLVDKQVLLNIDENVLQLTDVEMIDFLSVYNTYDDAKIASWSAQLAQSVNRQPINALFEFDGTKVTEFKPATNGRSLKQDQMSLKLKEAINILATQDHKTTHTIELPFEQFPPPITTETVNDLGIKELLGKGESWYSHSIASRVHNIGLSTSKIHGTLVAPGDVFSYVTTVGEIDAAHGYQPAYIIQNGRTILGDGGGVCQTSTALFRAALASGFEIVERHPHAYRVSYYEQNAAPGIDATIFSPSVDFKFRNDTDHHILIQAINQPSTFYLAFEIYGTRDGRQVSLTQPVVWDQLPPPPDQYQDDPSLPVGVVKQVDWKASGAKVSFDWKVVRNGTVLHEETFFSNYRPWQAVFLRGTGGV